MAKRNQGKATTKSICQYPKNYPLFSEVIERYKLQAKRKRGYEVYEKYILECLKKDFSNLPINKITTSILAEYRDRKLETVKEAPVKRHFNIIRHIDIIDNTNEFYSDYLIYIFYNIYIGIE